MKLDHANSSLLNHVPTVPFVLPCLLSPVPPCLFSPVPSVPFMSRAPVLSVPFKSRATVPAVPFKSRYILWNSLTAMITLNWIAFCYGNVCFSAQPQYSYNVMDFSVKSTYPPIWPIFTYVNLHYQQSIYTPYVNLTKFEPMKPSHSGDIHDMFKSIKNTILLSITFSIIKNIITIK